MATTEAVHIGDWVLVDGGAVRQAAPSPHDDGDIAVDADLEEERLHYPTEDREAGRALRHTPFAWEGALVGERGER